MTQPNEDMFFEGRPYLKCLKTLGNSFPALNSFLEKLANEADPGRQAVKLHYQATHRREPGRCYCLKFEDDRVTSVVQDGFENSIALREYLKKYPADQSRKNKCRRLFILEDMEPGFVDALGHHLGVDPLVFSEQMNTWNFTDSWSIPYRGLPSMSIPGQSFTLRYYELRTLFDPNQIDILSSQMSFAVNRRRYERWRDIDVPSAGKDRRHAFVRRCASFWTSQGPAEDPTLDVGWDAVIMVDPAFANTCELPHALERKTPSVSAMASNEETTPDGITLNQVTKAALEECNILQAPTPYDSRAALWKAQDWGEPQSFQVVAHKSWPYHNGCPTLAPLMFTEIGIGAKEANIQLFSDRRNLVSPLDEMVFYWTKLATRDLIHHTNKKSSNAAYYLLKHIAQHWVNQLELINTTVARGEWFSDDYQAQIDDNLSQARWKADLIKINEIGKDINYMRRHLNHFWRAMILNLERLGVQLGSETVDENASLALKGAQKDFLTLHTRMQPLRDRAEALSSVANDLANLRAAFRGVHDGEFSLRLSLFASIVFPLTLVAGIFSMGDDFRPGKPQFWKLWAIGPPFCLSLALGLIYGKRPWKVVSDLRNSMKEFLRGLGHVGINETDISRQTERNKSAGAHVVKSTSTVQRMIKRRKGSQQCDEEQGSRD